MLKRSSPKKLSSNSKRSRIELKGSKGKDSRRRKKSKRDSKRRKKRD